MTRGSRQGKARLSIIKSHGDSTHSGGAVPAKNKESDSRSPHKPLKNTASKARKEKTQRERSYDTGLKDNRDLPAHQSTTLTSKGALLANQPATLTPLELSGNPTGNIGKPN